MTFTKKEASPNSTESIFRLAFNDNLSSLSVGGFIASKVGHRITLQIQTTNVADDTELYSYYDGSNLLLQIKVIYTNSTREILSSVERVA